MKEIKVRINAELRVEVEFNVVRYFNELAADDRTQRLYWSLDGDEWGFDHEWERPLGWLTSEVSDAYETTGMGGYPKDHPICDHTSELDFLGERVAERDGVHAKWENGHWTEEDFETLVAAVPWLGRPSEAAPEVASTTPPMFTVDS